MKGPDTCPKGTKNATAVEECTSNLNSQLDIKTPKMIGFQGPWYGVGMAIGRFLPFGNRLNMNVLLLYYSELWPINTMSVKNMKVYISG